MTNSPKISGTEFLENLEPTLETQETLEAKFKNITSAEKMRETAKSILEGIEQNFKEGLPENRKGSLDGKIDLKSPENPLEKKAAEIFEEIKGLQAVWLTAQLKFNSLDDGGKEEIAELITKILETQDRAKNQIASNLDAEANGELDVDDSLYFIEDQFETGQLTLEHKVKALKDWYYIKATTDARGGEQEWLQNESILREVSLFMKGDYEYKIFASCSESTQTANAGRVSTEIGDYYLNDLIESNGDSNNYAAKASVLWYMKDPSYKKFKEALEKVEDEGSTLGLEGRDNSLRNVSDQLNFITNDIVQRRQKDPRYNKFLREYYEAQEDEAEKEKATQFPEEKDM